MTMTHLPRISLYTNTLFPLGVHDARYPVLLYRF